MVVNATAEYRNAELGYIYAKTTADKIKALKIMLKLCPKHKGSEKMVAELKRRLAKLKENEQKEKAIKKRRGHGLTIKKEADALVVMIGKTNSGKSSLLKALTNASPEISEIPYTTQKPEIGTIELGAKIQLVELPTLRGIEQDNEILSIVRISDLVLIVVTSIRELQDVINELKEAGIENKKLLVINKCDTLSEKDSMILKNLQNNILVSAKSMQGISELKEKIFFMLKLTRIYTKEPGKEATIEPLVLKEGSSIKDAAEKIHKEYSEKFLFARIWGKSAKFPGQKVGKEHILEDKDILEIHSR